MDVTLRYESNNGAVIEFKPDSVYHYAGATLHDYKHPYTTLGGRIVGFKHEVTDFELDVVVACGSGEDRDRMFEAFEFDVIVGKAGRLWSNGYYLRCYVTASKKSNWWWHDGYMHASITITSDEPNWVREAYKLFRLGEVGGTGIDYAHDWGFDYVSNVMIQDITNGSFVPVDFRMNVYGSVSDGVSIKVGDYTYAVDCVLGEGEVLTIDSREKSIVKTTATGEKSSLFSARVGEQVVGSGFYVFQKVESGNNFVSWPATYSFDMTLYETRAEPRWA